MAFWPYEICCTGWSWSNGELADEIEDIIAIAARSSGLANDVAVDELVERQYYLGFQDAIHSMAAVGMIAPFLESLLRRAYQRIECD